MDNEGDPNESNTQADGNGIAIGRINIGGDVSGDITIGHGYTAKQVSILLEQISATFQPKPFDGRCPYKGLDVFEEEDAELFFGREKLVEDLVARIKVSRTLFVTGPSGSGKSSLVRAGLIHALKQGGIKNSERWLYETMKPGRDPIGELGRVASSLASSTNAEDEIRAKALTDKTIFNRWCEIALKDGRDKRAVIFIDQFEEVFTQINKEEERVAFLNLLTHAATIEAGRIIILFAMRSDFVSNCATYPALNELLSQQFRQIGAMQPEELVSAMAQPALRVGLRIDPDLIAQVINDMKGEPGALPLMQFTLKDLFDAQQAKGGLIALTLDDYIQNGGIQKSLERHADAAFAMLEASEQELARWIFGGLIEIGRGTQDTRRTALFDELIPPNTKAENVEVIVHKLADARLIITDEQAGRDIVTISHEKLIDAWPWLKKLVNENRDVIALQNEIANDAKEWDDHRRDSSYLYRGARLASAHEKLEAGILVLSDLAQIFVNTGSEIEENERLKEEARRQKELDDARRLAEAEAQRAEEQTRSATKLRQRARFLAMSLVVALISAGVAIFYGVQSQRQARSARVGELTATTVNLREFQPLLSLLMGIESFRFEPNLQTSSVLIDNLNLDPQVLQYFSGQSENLKGVAVSISPDGKVLASASDDGAITLWDLQTRQQIGVLPGKSSNIAMSLAFSPDGKTLASGHEANTITFWDVRTQDPIGSPLTGHSKIVRSVAFSPDGKTLASGSEDETIILWDVQTHQTIGQPFTGHSAVIYSIAFSPDGQTLASGSVDQTVILWDIQTHKPISQPFTGHTDWVKSVVFSPDGKVIASGGVDETIILWNTKTHQQIGKPMTDHSGEIRSLAFSPDGNVLASGSADKTIILWDVKTQDPVSQPFTGHTERVVSIAFSPDGKTLASAGDDGLTILWDAQTRLPMGQVLSGHNNSVTSVAFSPNGKIFASASNDQSIIIWDSLTGQPIGDPIISISLPIKSIAFSPDGETLAAGYADGKIILLDILTRATIGTPLSKHHENITNIAFSPDGKVLASASLDDTIILWEVQTHKSIGQPLTGHSADVWSVAFSPEGTTLASGGADNNIILWDLKTQKPRGLPLSGHSKRVNSVAFSPDGKFLASGSFDRTIMLWDVQTQKPIRLPLVEHSSTVWSIAFSPDGKTLASGSADNTIILWDFLTFQTIGQPLRGDSSSITSLAFSSDNKSLASGSSNGDVILWDLDPESWIQKTCQRIDRNFTSGEWVQYFEDQAYRITCLQWPSGK
jgi:WD40 repeat protein